MKKITIFLLIIFSFIAPVYVTCSDEHNNSQDVHIEQDSDDSLPKEGFEESSEQVSKPTDIDQEEVSEQVSKPTCVDNAIEKCIRCISHKAADKWSSLPKTKKRSFYTACTATGYILLIYFLAKRSRHNQAEQELAEQA